jgi:carbamoyl-phosphate synthase large subunit
MKSTGEVMGIGQDFGVAFAKAQMASHNRIPLSGRFFISVKDKDKPQAAEIAKKLAALGIKIIATRGTAKYFNDRGIVAETVNKVIEGSPNIVDMIKEKQIDFVINTVTGKQAQSDSFSIRRSSLQYKVPYTTTISGAKAALYAIEKLRTDKIDVKSIQEYHKMVKRTL